MSSSSCVGVPDPSVNSNNKSVYVSSIYKNAYKGY